MIGLLIIIINYIMYQAIIIIKYEMVLLYLKNMMGVHHIHITVTNYINLMLDINELVNVLSVLLLQIMVNK